ncbi:uncharacterized protein LOC126888557 [Diabrotica virgifera virgifera]|uniref:Suppressor protein SRP40-like n=1 Tax=Diabrotica virgifera virgifera TaxID=50390 RepID=A0ABM5KRP6_DIAVI|nr:uncharacterized protein LOC126888557 [Diabrotica virgifera virgifera]
MHSFIKCVPMKRKTTDSQESAIDEEQGNSPVSQANIEESKENNIDNSCNDNSDNSEDVSHSENWCFDPNYESDSSSSSSSSSSTSNDSSSLTSIDSPGCNGFLSNSNNVSQVADTPLADSQAVNTPATSIQVSDVEVADTLEANLQASGPEVPDTQLADTQPANTQPADTKIASPKKTGKKRVAVAENWLSNKAKKLRNSGQAYTSRSKSQKPIVARSIRPACGDKCRLKCSNKTDENTRKDILKKYWTLENINRQREFIHKWMKPVKPAYRYSSADRPRQHNNSYYFHINNNEQVRVCKYFFMAT